MLIEAVLAPVLQMYVPPPPAVNVVEPPAQITEVPAILAVGIGFTVNVRLAEAVQPVALVTVTVYAPAVFTVIAGVTAPVLHK